MKFKKPLKLPIETAEHDNCPGCKVSLIGDPIPKDIQEHYGKSTHWRREIGIYDLYLDRTVKYRCPDCKVEWDVLTGDIVEYDILE